MKRILIVGGSRGLGAAFASGIPAKDDKVWLLSRTAPPLHTCPAREKVWINADLRRPLEASAALQGALRQEPLDLLLYCAGIWEDPSFAAVPDDQILDIINVNLTGFILCLRRLAPNLRRAANAHVVAIGSTCGLENEGSDAVAYAASKFGLRGAVHAGRELFRDAGVAVTCVSPGSMASDVPLGEDRAAAIEKHGGRRMPLQDVVSLVRWIQSLEGGSCPKEIHLPAMLDTDV